MRLFQINEDDLETLENTLPDLMARGTVSGAWCDEQRKQWEMVRNVVARVRWNYGPPIEVKEVGGDEKGEAKQ